jgi:hypothetical protein
MTQIRHVYSNLRNALSISLLVYYLVVGPHYLETWPRVYEVQCPYHCVGRQKLFYFHCTAVVYLECRLYLVLTFLYPSAFYFFRICIDT